MEKTEALIIRQVDFSESSRIVTMFTREFGKTAALAKGAKRLKGPFEASLDLLATMSVVFIRKQGGTLDLLTEAKLVRRFTPPGDVMRLYAAYYVAELLDSLSEPYDPHPALYDTAQDVLIRLMGDTDLQLAVMRFELLLLLEIGQVPAFDMCALCGRIVEGEALVAFKWSQGGIICRDCLSGAGAHVSLTGGALAALRVLSDPDSADWFSVPVTAFQYQEMRGLLTNVISHTLGHRPKMLKYLMLGRRKAPDVASN